MTRTPEKTLAINVTVAAAVVFVASFLPWGTFRGAPAFPFGNSPLAGMELSVTSSAWNGSISAPGLGLPNWLVVVAALAVAATAWLKATAAWVPPAALPMALAAYGFLHASWWIVAVGVAGKASVGVGSLLTGLAFTGMLVALVRRRRELQAGVAKAGGRADDAVG